MLTIESLVFAYGAVRALDDLTVTFERGEICGLIGPNGAGKSTAIDAISGRVTPRGGHIGYEGVDITKKSVIARHRMGISRSFQRMSVFPRLSIGQQLRLAAAVSDDGRHRTADIIDAFELVEFLHEPCGETSYGVQRRVDLALSLVSSPRLLLLDEPAAGLTRDESLRLCGTLVDLVREMKSTVIIVEHDMEVIFSLCDRVVVLARGQLLAQGSPDLVRVDERVVSAYLGDSA